MASYTKTLKVIDSSNSSDRIYTSSNNYFVPQQRSNMLYVSKQNLDQNYQTNSYIKYSLEDLIGKTITRTTLHLYMQKSYDAHINVGRNSPKRLSAGWNLIDLDWTNEIITSQLIKEITISQDDYLNYNYTIFTSSMAPSNKPYLVIEYEDTPPNQPTNLFPYNSNMDARMPIRFSWKYSSYDNKEQTGYTIQYSTDNQSTWTTVTQESSDQFHDFNPNTFPETATVYWRIKVKDGIGLESNYSTIVKFNTSITPQKAPIIISPTTGYLDGNKEIEFSWRFLGGSDYDIQSKFDLDYSSNEGETWTTITQETNMQSYTAPPNTFPSGSYAWRVRTYNAFGEVSPYSEIAKFNIISEPPLPQIQSVTNASRPLVTWISSEQQAYELDILQNGDIVLSSGVVPSLTKEHKLGQYLQDGNYIARLRVTNQYNLTSPWAEYSFNINTSSNKPPKPQITIYNEEYGVTIKVIGSSNTNLVYRDGKEIGVMDGKTFTDYTGKNNVLHRYFVRSINAQDNFNDSDTKLGKCSFRYNTLATASNPKDYLVLKYGLNYIPKKTGEIRSLGEIQHFDGRTYPTIEYSEFRTLSKTVSFILESKDELEKLEFLINKNEPLLYRNNDNKNIYGVILSVAHEETMFGYVIDLSITKVGDRHD